MPKFTISTVFALSAAVAICHGQRVGKAPDDCVGCTLPPTPGRRPDSNGYTVVTDSNGYLLMVSNKDKFVESADGTLDGSLFLRETNQLTLSGGSSPGQGFIKKTASLAGMQSMKYDKSQIDLSNNQIDIVNDAGLKQLNGYEFDGVHMFNFCGNVMSDIVGCRLDFDDQGQWSYDADGNKHIAHAGATAIEVGTNQWIQCVGEKFIFFLLVRKRKFRTKIVKIVKFSH